MSVRPFYPSIDANTYAVDVTDVSSAALQIVGKGSAVRIANSGTAAVAVNVGILGLSAAVFPAAGAPSDCLYLLPGVVEVFTLPLDCYVRAITATGTATIYLVRGEGV